MSKYNITETIYLEKENNKISIYSNNILLKVLNEYSEIVDYLKEICDVDTFLTKIAVMEKTGFFKDIMRHELDQEKVLGAIGKIVAWGDGSDNYVDNYSTSDLELLDWFFKNIYSFKIDRSSLITLGHKIGHDQDEREDYLETHGEKHIEYLQRIYWITIKHKNGIRFDRPVFYLEGSLKKAMVKLQEKVIEIRNKKRDWEEIKNRLEKCRKNITKVYIKFSQEINTTNVKLALNHDWKDIFQIGCVFKIEDLWDLECLKYKLKQLETRNYVIRKKKNEKSYWRLREKESKWFMI